MYPSPRVQHPLVLGPAVASPKKKPKPHAARGVFALPAIQQFEPVLAASGVSPRVSTELPGEVSSSVVSPRQPLKLHQDAKASPRMLRPQPPPPVAVIASRTDQDLFRYSQGVRQRMAIRPLFEQRREEEAETARRILTSRGTTAESSGRELEADVAEPLTTPPSVHSISRRSSTPVTASELAERRSASPSAALTSTPRSRDGLARGGDGPATETEDTRDLDGGVEFVSVRFRTPTPPSSASGPTRRLITTAERNMQRAGSDDEPRDCRDESPDVAPDLAVDAFVAGGEEEAGTSGEGEPQEPSRDSMVQHGTADEFHDPFLEREAPKMAWLRRKPSVLNAEPTSTTALRLAASAASSVCYKLLWKDVKNFNAGGAHCVSLSVLLGSHGKAHIDIAPSDGDTTTTLEVTEADLLLSTKTRPDLPVMTPRWAQWLLTRVERDVNGVWFVRVQDLLSMEESCVFSGDVHMPPGVEEHKEAGGLSLVGVSIYLLGDCDSLLVHARDKSSTLGPLTELVVMRHEVASLATTLGLLSNESEDETSAQSRLSALMRDKDFLHQAVVESKTLRLALCSGLHEATPANAVAGLPFRTGTRTASRPAEAMEGLEIASVSDDVSRGQLSTTIGQLEAQGLSYSTPEVQAIVRSSDALVEVAFLAQAYCEDAVMAALRIWRRQDAVKAYVASYLSCPFDRDSELHETVKRRVEAAKRAKLEDLAARAIIDDMIDDFIAFDCRLELHNAKYSGGYDDYYASKVQAAYRMSYQRRAYVNKKNVRARAARLIQALQRGIVARRRYCEMRVEREKYLFFGFRSSLHRATARIEDPRQRSMDLAREAERRRHTFLMQVVHGYVAQHGLPLSFRLSPELVQSILNEHGVIVGCAPTLGDSVAAILVSSRHPDPPSKNEAKVPPPRSFGSSEIQAALLTALRMQYDDTYGLSSSIRRLDATEKSPTKAHLMIRSSPTDENTPPRWLLKISPPFQRASKNRLAALRLTRQAAGQRAAHLVALDYRRVLADGFQHFDNCRAIWETSIRARVEQTRRFDAFSVDDLTQFALDRLILAVKDWGLDAEPLFEALNVCLLHRLGKEAIARAEEGFNRFAEGVNAMHGKRNIYPLREEITQELEEFEALLALRCLNIATDKVASVPPSEVLHVLLNGRVDHEYLRHALPAVLPIASIGEKEILARKMITAYANTTYGDAFNAICWSCLDSAENITVEAAQFLERITRHEDRPSEGPDVSIATRALHVLTGSHSVRFLHFLSKVAHFNKSMQRRVLDHLARFADEFELYRLASVVCSLESFEVVARLFDVAFEASAVHASTRFWVQYSVLYGEEKAEEARASCRRGLQTDETTGKALSPPERSETTVMASFDAAPLYT